MVIFHSCSIVSHAGGPWHINLVQSEQTNFAATSSEGVSLSHHFKKNPFHGYTYSWTYCHFNSLLSKYETVYCKWIGWNHSGAPKGVFQVSDKNTHNLEKCRARRDSFFKLDRDARNEQNKTKSGFISRKILKHVQNIIVKVTRYNRYIILYRHIIIE